MFEQKQSAPGYKSRTLLIGVCVVVVLVVGAAVVFKVVRSRSKEAHYDELEANRRQQAEQVAAAPVATPAPATQASPGASPGGSPGTSPAAPAPQTATRNYWTNFRGPKRDGNYEEKPVLASWPANGLTPLWKQPVGLGYSSFSVADGRAYRSEEHTSELQSHSFISYAV